MLAHEETKDTTLHDLEERLKYVEFTGSEVSKLDAAIKKSLELAEMYDKKSDRCMIFTLPFLFSGASTLLPSMLYHPYSDDLLPYLAKSAENLSYGLSHISSTVSTMLYSLSNWFYANTPRYNFQAENLDANIAITLMAPALALIFAGLYYNEQAIRYKNMKPSQTNELAEDPNKNLPRSVG